MNLGCLIRTIRHLKPIQVLYQVKYRLIKYTYSSYNSYDIKVNNSCLKTEPIVKNPCLEGDKFTFLNIEREFAGWNFMDNGMLWAYNQNYFDWINQDGCSEKEGCKWIDKFIKDLPENKVGLDAYPIALRTVNWVYFFCKYPQAATKERLDSLYSQIKLLEKKLEYHLLGNHLLEDAYALYIATSFFCDDRLLKKSKKLLKEQLREQILPDGAHYEQSPMYHCILLHRLLDCININPSLELEQYATEMLGHLESIKWRDGGIPMLNDSAMGIAPTTSQLFCYAKRLGLNWEKKPMKECGYRKLIGGNMEVIIDVGNITASYQPGHTHADTFNYELRIEGKPFIVDTGISTYNKTKRRQVERSTIVHNCVSPNGKDSSEVWDCFRVGKRCHTDIIEDTNSIVDATHDGFGKLCRRRFEININGFTVEDWYDGEAISYIHIAEGNDEFRFVDSKFKIEGARDIEYKPWKYSTEYNQFHEGKLLKIKFKGYCKYTIQY